MIVQSLTVLDFSSPHNDIGLGTELRSTTVESVTMARRDEGAIYLLLYAAAIQRAPF